MARFIFALVVLAMIAVVHGTPGPMPGTCPSGKCGCSDATESRGRDKCKTLSPSVCFDLILSICKTVDWSSRYERNVVTKIESEVDRTIKVSVSIPAGTATGEVNGEAVVVAEGHGAATTFGVTGTLENYADGSLAEGAGTLNIDGTAKAGRRLLQ